MRKTLGLMVAAIMALAGCATTGRSYSVDVVVKPSDGDQYTVEFKIGESTGGSYHVISAPTVLMHANEEACCVVAGSADERGVICNALVKEQEKSVQAKVTVLIRENRQDIWKFDQTLAVSR
jgi:hypothetical protein